MAGDSGELGVQLAPEGPVLGLRAAALTVQTGVQGSWPRLPDRSQAPDLAQALGDGVMLDLGGEGRVGYGVVCRLLPKPPNFTPQPASLKPLSGGLMGWHRVCLGAACTFRMSSWLSASKTIASGASLLSEPQKPTVRRPAGFCPSFHHWRDLAVDVAELPARLVLHERDARLDRSGASVKGDGHGLLDRAP